MIFTLLFVAHLFVYWKIVPAAAAEQGTVNFGHVLEEPLDVGPLAAELALLTHFPGFDPACVVKFYSFRIRR